MSSLDPLLPHLYADYTNNWSEARWETLRALAKGRNPGGQAEPTVTEMLCAVDGPVGRALANILLGLAGRPASPDAEMVKPTEYAVHTSGGLRAPDVGVRDAAANRILLVAEGKRNAHINVGHCPEPGEYGSQVVCYPHGCWTHPGALEDTGFLWLHPYDTEPWKERLNERLLDNRGWVEYAGSSERLRGWIDAQGTAIVQQWRTATWENLATRVHDLREPAAGVIAKIISTWLAR